MKITIETVVAMLNARIESEEPEQILEVFKKEAGKPLSKRILAKLPGGEDRWILGERYGSKELYDRAHLRSGGNEGFCYTLSPGFRHTTGLKVDPVALEERNPTYFSGRRNRNAKIRAMVNDRQALALLAQRMQHAVDAREVYTEALSRVQVLIGYDTNADPIRYDVQKLVEYKA